MPTLGLLLPVLLSTATTAAPAETSSGATCQGATTMPNHRDRDGVTIVRTGTGHSADLVRTDGDGTVHLEQHGRDHAAMSVQSGNGDRLTIDQRGASASADVTQTGACNDTALVQNGADNTATVRQSGSGNRAVVRQGPAPQTRQP